MAAQSLGGLSLQGSRKGKLCFPGAFSIVEARSAFSFTIRETESGKTDLQAGRCSDCSIKCRELRPRNAPVREERQTLGPC